MTALLVLLDKVSAIFDKDRLRRCRAARAISCGGASSSTSIRLGPCRASKACRSWASKRPTCAGASTTSHHHGARPGRQAAPVRHRGPCHQMVQDFPADLKSHGGDPAEVRHVRMDGHQCGPCQRHRPGAAAGRHPLRPLPRVAMATQTMGDVRREELRTEPEQVAAALLGADAKKRRNLPRGYAAKTRRAGPGRRLLPYTGCCVRRARARTHVGCAWR